MIAVVDYGLGNIRAFVNVYMRLGIGVTVAKKAADLEAAEKIILPGVGSFDPAMDALDRSGMRDRLGQMVVEKHVPLLGVCVGMQMLANSSEEGNRPGLCWIRGAVKKFDAVRQRHSVRVPHMGWNSVKPVGQSRLFAGLDEQSLFYFLHSYHFECDDPGETIGVSDYHGEFVCAVALGNVFGVQFHPEKSHGWGMKLLENFAKL